MKEKSYSKPGIFSKVLEFSSKFIDFRAAIAGAVIMGVIVGYINRKFGVWPASTAALKQAAYTFLFGGVMTRLLYIIAGKIKGLYTAAIFSSIIISVITIGLVFGVHSMKGTPLPLESTIPTAILAPIGFFALAFRKKRKSIQ